MNFIKTYLDKFITIKENKKMALVVVAGFMVIILIFISEINFSDKEKKNEVNNAFSKYEYCEYLEEKITDIIEAIDGAGKTKVMITLSETTEYIYATNDKNTQKNSSNNNDSTKENDYVIIEKDNNDTGLLIKTVEPKIRGVAIVCEGGNNTTVQNQIYSAVSAVLNVSMSRISISKLTYMEE